MELLRRLNMGQTEFRGRVAIVTGAARGLGEQVARGLAWLGAETVLVDNRSDSVAHFVSGIHIVEMQRNMAV